MFQNSNGLASEPTAQYPTKRITALLGTLESDIFQHDQPIFRQPTQFRQPTNFLRDEPFQGHEADCPQAVTLTQEVHANGFLVSPLDVRGYDIQWGARVPGLTGVAALTPGKHMRGHAHITQVSLADDYYLGEHYAAGRVQLIQVWQGAKVLRIYNVYLDPAVGAAAARARRRLLTAVFQHQRVLGAQVPTIVGGDLNETPETLLSHFPPGWIDAAVIGARDPAVRTAPTSKAGLARRRIDWVVANPQAAELVVNYQVHDYNIPAHWGVKVTMCLERCTTRVACAMRKVRPETWEMPPRNYVPPETTLPREYYDLLGEGQPTQAYELLNNIMEGTLLQAGHFGVCNEGRRDGRGRVLLTVQPQAAGCVREQAATARTRAMLRDVRRCEDLKALLARQDVGERARRVWAQVGQSWHSLSPETQQVIHPFLQLPLCNWEGVEYCRQRFDQALQEEQAWAKAKREQHWRADWRLNGRNGTRFLKEGPRPRNDGLMERKDGSMTADTAEQLELVYTEWEPILTKHRYGEPSIDEFFAIFGPFMRSAPMNLNDLTAEDVEKGIAAQKSGTANGLTDWQAEELEVVIAWHPATAHGLAAMYNFAEAPGGDWPDPVVETYTSLADKPGETRRTPGVKRPLTVTERLYRIWGACRKQLLMLWQESWCHDGVFGGRLKRSAVECYARTNLQLARRVPGILKVAGDSMDFRKAYDLLPLSFAIDCWARRGASPRLVRGVRAYYKKLRRRFKLGRSLGAVFEHFGGLLQGCLYSQSILASMACAWVEKCASLVGPNTHPRVYIDDMHAITEGATDAEVVEELDKVQGVTDEYVRYIGELNFDKTYRFGDRLAVPSVFAHKPELRLLGAAMLEQADRLSDLVLARRKAYLEYLARLPIGPWTSFRQRSEKVAQRHTKLSYGVESFPLHKHYLVNPIRTAVQVALWGKPGYIAPPELTLTLTMSPSVDPHYGLAAEALAIYVRDDTARQEVVTQWNNGVRIGPVGRLRQIATNRVFLPYVRDLVGGGALSDRFLHDMRQAWREHRWLALAARKPAEYAGLDGTLDRMGTLLLHSWLTREARLYQEALDKRRAKEFCDDRRLDVRYRLAVLHALHHGCMWTPARKASHFGGGINPHCRCGALGTVLHVSWECPLYQAERAPALEILGDWTTYPRCYQYALLVTAPTSQRLTQEQLWTVQNSILSVWLADRANYEGDDYLEGKPPDEPDLHAPDQFPPEAPPQPQPPELQVPTHTREGEEIPPIWRVLCGHELSLVADPQSQYAGRHFCRRCGQLAPAVLSEQLNYFRQRGSQCSQKNNVDVNTWALAPIAHFQHYNQAKQEADEEEWTAETVNGHQLQWNGKRGRVARRDETLFEPDDARLKCVKCTRSWPWSQKQRIKFDKACTETAAKMNIRRVLEEQKLREWKAANPESHHDFAFHRETDRWYCTRCRGCGTQVWRSGNPSGYATHFLRFAETACERHAELEAIT